MKTVLKSLLLLSLALNLNVIGADSFTLKKGDHVAIIGNALGERMQHFNYLEALIYARYPKEDLVFRNLAVPGDEVAGFLAESGNKKDANNNYRMRSENFGSSDDWLTKEKADVIFAFFGFNESFAGDAGLAAFKDNLGKFIKHVAGQNYSGKGAPRVVFFSPIAKEKINDPNLPDPTANNAYIQKYAAAMAEVAKANNV